MRRLRLIVLPLMLVMGLSGCETFGETKPSPAPPTVIESPPMRLQAPPAELMEPEEANFLDRLLNTLSPKPPAPTK